MRRIAPLNANRFAEDRIMEEKENPEEFLTQRRKRRPEEFEFVKVQVEDGVARMTLNRPEHNLLNESMQRELAD